MLYYKTNEPNLFPAEFLYSNRREKLINMASLQVFAEQLFFALCSAIVYGLLFVVLYYVSKFLWRNFLIYKSKDPSSKLSDLLPLPPGDFGIPFLGETLLWAIQVRLCLFLITIQCQITVRYLLLIKNSLIVCFFHLNRVYSFFYFQCITRYNWPIKIHSKSPMPRHTA